MSIAPKDTLLLSSAAMGAVDAAAIASGIDGPWLMENAGRWVTREIVDHFAPCGVLVLAGPGNNGGDGYVVARRLAAAGWPVTVAALGNPKPGTDAAQAAARWSGPTAPLKKLDTVGRGLVVDALFGAGLARDLDDDIIAILRRIAASGLPVVAVDVPSGIDGSTGAVRGFALHADLTVTFAARKPGHLLLPGRKHCGKVACRDIGLPFSILAAHDEGARANDPALWVDRIPRRSPDRHKYSFGHAVVAGGDGAAGASIMAVRAALRAGAGLASVACTSVAQPVYAAHLVAEMTKVADRPADFDALIADERVTGVLLGPGLGISLRTRQLVEIVLARRKAVVLDADAITTFTDDPASLFVKLHRDVVLTPHEGEFRRLFSFGGTRLERVRQAAREAGAVVVLKGNDTIVAAPPSDDWPQGRVAIAGPAPPVLATAGAGDVLAGIITGLLAQGLPTFEAAMAAVWLHARAAEGVRGRLVAADLPDRLPSVLATLENDTGAPFG